ncbi:hypothetical protein CDAR_431341 [Caerostris darwini]|uniref:Uncharacterized protein n=1 Tax=Caerostris darwini TaxID=1538125 RepID=A0AAV4RRL5_9ARAC|nr:hypothetical protein CDAR_431341 [Caerostris darwini]
MLFITILFKFRIFHRYHLIQEEPSLKFTSRPSKKNKKKKKLGKVSNQKPVASRVKFEGQTTERSCNEMSASPVIILQEERTGGKDRACHFGLMTMGDKARGILRFRQASFLSLF